MRCQVEIGPRSTRHLTRHLLQNQWHARRSRRGEAPGQARLRPVPRGRPRSGSGCPRIETGLPLLDLPSALRADGVVQVDGGVAVRAFFHGDRSSADHTQAVHRRYTDRVTESSRPPEKCPRLARGLSLQGSPRQDPVCREGPILEEARGLVLHAGAGGREDRGPPEVFPGHRDDRHEHGARGAAPREHPHQEAPAPVQHLPARRQDLPLHQDHDGSRGRGPSSRDASKTTGTPTSAPSGAASRGGSCG